VLGDQLDREMPVLEQLDPKQDVIVMAEVEEESAHVPSQPQRTILFLSSMRHFARDLASRGFPVRYVTLDDAANTQSLGSELARAARELRPARIAVTQPGEHRVEAVLRDTAERSGVPLSILPDESFTCSLDEFRDWAQGRKRLVMEHFYRERRRALGVLVGKDGKPEGGRWNFDTENRAAFSDEPDASKPYSPRPDAITREVMDLVRRRFLQSYGRMDRFRWPVTPAQARRALGAFIERRLPRFGTYQDAMWTGEPFLFHSLLASSLNLKLVRPRECIDAALKAYRGGRASLNNVEGFIRQIIGWREFIRGVYYLEGPEYAERNGLGQKGRLPEFFWTGETDMGCLRHAVNEVLDHGYGHHIARLMVIGNFALIAGVHPRAVHEWFLGMYVDAVEWVTAPNVIGMSQYADGGVVATKPYAASGKYIQRMSNYCSSCPYDPGKRAGERACPFNTFYWDFLMRHRKRFAGNRRMGLVMRGLDRLDRRERREIAEEASRLRREMGIG
jgi:deoxyribodipyrimidine photolyase-related protein